MRFSLEEWRSLAQPFYEVHPRVAAAEASVEIEARTLGDLLLSRVSMPPQMLVHDPRTRKAVCHDYLLFERFHTGGGHGQVDGLEFAPHPSRLHLIDMSRRYISVQQRSRSQGVLLPHRLFGYDPSVDPGVVTIDLDTPRGQLLSSAHAVLAQQNDKDTAEDLVAIFVSMVERFMLGRSGEAVRARAETALPFALRSHIEANLEDAMLTPEALCSAFGISRSALYRCFEDTGGVARYMRHRRLDRCFFELAGSKKERGRVSAVARRWGFTDPTAFMKHFKQRFGMAPSECLAKDAALAPPTSSIVEVTIDLWLRELQHR